MVKKQIPNLITLGNLLFGVLACYCALQGSLQEAALAICAGIILDFFDGLAARLLKVPSALGKELDSLADLVTSGLAPAFIVYTVLKNGLAATFEMTGEWHHTAYILAALVLLMPLFAAYRLAKFNIDERQGHSFRGLPTPANALIWVGFALALPNMGEGICLEMNTLDVDHCYPVFFDIWQFWWLPTIIVSVMVLNILMVSSLPMFSLKFNFKDLSWKTNCVQYIFLIGCIAITVAMIFLQKRCGGMHSLWFALPLSILWYIVLSIITMKRTQCQEVPSK